MERERIIILMEVVMKANGRMIYSMVMELKTGLTIQNSVVSIKKGRSRVMVSTDGMTAQPTKAIGKATSFKD